MLGLSFETLTALPMYSCHNREKFPQQIPTQLTSKPRSFSHTFIALSNSTYILSISETKITLIASIFPELLIPKNVDT